MRPTHKKRDQRRREAFLRESRKERPEVVVLGPIDEDLKREVLRDLLSLR